MICTVEWKIKCFNMVLNSPFYESLKYAKSNKIGNANFVIFKCVRQPTHIYLLSWQEHSKVVKMFQKSAKFRRIDRKFGNLPDLEHHIFYHWNNMVERAKSFIWYFNILHMKILIPSYCYMQGAKYCPYCTTSLLYFD